MLIFGMLLLVLLDVLIVTKGVVLSYIKHASHRKCELSYTYLAQEYKSSLLIRAHSALDRALADFISWHCNGFFVQTKYVLSTGLAEIPGKKNVNVSDIKIQP